MPAPAFPPDAMTCGDAASTLRIGGLVPFSTTDWPGQIAAVLFCQGCPWKCGYCHNPHLIPILKEPTPGSKSWREVSVWLQNRQGLLDAVVFSGGEPLVQAALPQAMREARDMGFRVGLHTGGASPQRLQSALPLVDWVGFDLKAMPQDYERTTGVPGSGIKAGESLDMLLQSATEVEVRTTVHGALLGADDLLHMARWLQQRGVRCWVLQPFRAAGCDNAALLHSAAPQPLHDAQLVQQLKAHIPTLEIRG